MEKKNSINQTISSSLLLDLLLEIINLHLQPKRGNRRPNVLLEVRFEVRILLFHSLAEPVTQAEKLFYQSFFHFLVIEKYSHSLADLYITYCKDNRYETQAQHLIMMFFEILTSS